MTSELLPEPSPESSPASSSELLPNPAAELLTELLAKPMYPDALPAVSVIVPVYNSEAEIAEMIGCLLAQDYPMDRVEFLLVDNHSRDRTAAVIAAIATHHPQLKLLHENAIQSSYAARNTGIRQAQHDFLVFTDADCRPEPQWLRYLVQPFQQPEVGLVAGQIEALAPQTFLERYAERSKILSQKYTLAHPFCPYGQTANLAVRRSILQRVGLFRPYLTTGGDADFCWRVIRETGCQIQLAERAIVRHRHRATWQALAEQWRRYGVSNQYLHELHAIGLKPKRSTRYLLQQLLRWLGKEIPRECWRMLQGRGSWVALWSIPISIYTGYAYEAGQRSATLPPQAREIAQF